MFKNLLAGSASAIALLVAMPSYAQEVTPTPVSDIIVTATRSARSIADVPASVSVVTSAEIEGTPAKTLDDVLRRLPSVDLPIASSYQVHPTALNISMRGLGGIRALVLLDGVPLNDPFFGYIQWSQVPLETVDRVEVVRGGGATLWGNYAMGGVINILTKPIDRTGLVVEAAGGSYGTYRSDGHAAYAGNGFGIGLDAGINHTDGYLQPTPEFRGPIDVPTSFTAHNVALSGNVDITPSLTARARVSYFDNRQNLLTRLQANRQRTWRYTGSLTQKLGATGTLALTVFHDNSRFTTYNTGAPDGADPTQVEYVQNMHRTPERDLGASLVWSQTFTGILRELSAGVDYHSIRGTDYASIFDQTGAQGRTDIGSGRQRFLGGFVQADVRPVKSLEILLSVRYQGFLNYRGTDLTPGGLGANVPDRHDTDIDPRLSVRYAVTSALALHGAVYRAFRAPTLDNLYRAFAIPGGIYYGNATLRPETLEGAEVGFDIAKGPIRFQTTAFASRIKDLITTRNLSDAELPAGFFFGGRLINAGRASSRGVEVELDWRMTPKLTATFAYTYADSVVTNNPEDPASVGVQQASVPKNKASAGVDWTGPYGIKVSPRVRYVSRTNGDSDGLLHTDPHFIADLEGSVPLSHGFEAFVQIENLFDRRYVGTNDGYSAPLYGTPLTAIGGVRVKL
uniref:TonB-dependent receptor n=1 Tax=uncultured Sphingomonas sp. TaxID=158754 RepID=UPI0035CA67B5